MEQADPEDSDKTNEVRPAEARPAKATPAPPPGKFAALRRMIPKKFDHPGRGKSFVYFQIALIAAVLVVYLFYKKYHPAEPQNVFSMVQIDQAGIVTVTSPEDIDWFVGAEKFLPIREQIRQRNEQITALREQVFSHLALLGQYVQSADADRLMAVQRSIATGWPAPVYASLNPNYHPTGKRPALVKFLHELETVRGLNDYSAKVLAEEKKLVEDVTEQIEALDRLIPALSAANTAYQKAATQGLSDQTALMCALKKLDPKPAPTPPCPGEPPPAADDGQGKPLSDQIAALGKSIQALDTLIAQTTEAQRTIQTELLFPNYLRKKDQSPAAPSTPPAPDYPSIFATNYVAQQEKLRDITKALGSLQTALGSPAVDGQLPGHGDSLSALTAALIAQEQHRIASAAATQDLLKRIQAAIAELSTKPPSNPVEDLKAATEALKDLKGLIAQLQPAKTASADQRHRLTTDLVSIKDLLAKIQTAIANPPESLQPAAAGDPKAALTKDLETAVAALAKISATITKLYPPTGDPGVSDIMQRATVALTVFEASFDQRAAPDAAWVRFLSGLPVSLRNTLPTGLVADVTSDLSRWQALHDAQAASLAALVPPAKTLFFALTPLALIMEVLVWSFLGVLTNLALNTAEAVRANKYRPVERFIGYTKLAYGPVLALVICLAVIHGIINLGDYVVRSFSLPVIAFLLGYAARKTASLIDRVAEKFLGDANKSVDEGFGAAQKRLYDRVASLALPPTTASFETSALQTANRLIVGIMATRAKNN